MVWPVLLGVLTVGVVTLRAGSRAWKRYKSLPPDLFDFKPPVVQDPKKNDSRFYFGGFEKEMSIEEAKLILGSLNKHSHLTRDELHRLHRKTMLMNHPDRGGSQYLAMKINEAKDKLDKHIK